MTAIVLRVAVWNRIAAGIRCEEVLVAPVPRGETNN